MMATNNEMTTKDIFYLANDVVNLAISYYNAGVN